MGQKRKFKSNRYLTFALRAPAIYSPASREQECGVSPVKPKLHPNIDRDLKKAIAWAVHAFTTCGIVAGFLALVAVLKNDPVAAFMWLGLALFVDGRTLDNVIDFFNYTAVPALMVYWFEMVPGALGIGAAAAIMAVSCYTFANTAMKSDDYYFVGFPALWNVVVQAPARIARALSLSNHQAFTSIGSPAAFHSGSPSSNRRTLKPRARNAATASNESTQ